MPKKFYTHRPKERILRDKKARTLFGSSDDICNKMMAMCKNVSGHFLSVRGASGRPWVRLKGSPYTPKPPNAHTKSCNDSCASPIGGLLARRKGMTRIAGKGKNRKHVGRADDDQAHQFSHIKYNEDGSIRRRPNQFGKMKKGSKSISEEEKEKLKYAIEFETDLQCRQMLGCSLEAFKDMINNGVDLKLDKESIKYLQDQKIKIDDKKISVYDYLKSPEFETLNKKGLKISDVLAVALELTDKKIADITKITSIDEREKLDKELKKQFKGLHKQISKPKYYKTPDGILTFEEGNYCWRQAEITVEEILEYVALGQFIITGWKNGKLRLKSSALGNLSSDSMPGFDGEFEIDIAGSREPFEGTEPPKDILSKKFLGLNDEGKKFVSWCNKSKNKNKLHRPCTVSTIEKFKGETVIAPTFVQAGHNGEVIKGDPDLMHSPLPLGLPEVAYKVYNTYKEGGIDSFTDDLDSLYFELGKKEELSEIEKQILSIDYETLCLLFLTNPKWMAQQGEMTVGNMVLHASLNLMFIKDYIESNHLDEFKYLKKDSSSYINKMKHYLTHLTTDEVFVISQLQHGQEGYNPNKSEDFGANWVTINGEEYYPKDEDEYIDLLGDKLIDVRVHPSRIDGPKGDFWVQIVKLQLEKGRKLDDKTLEAFIKKESHDETLLEQFYSKKKSFIIERLNEIQEKKLIVISKELEYLEDKVKSAILPIRKLSKLSPKENKELEKFKTKLDQELTFFKEKFIYAKGSEKRNILRKEYLQNLLNLINKASNKNQDFLSKRFFKAITGKLFGYKKI